MKYLYEIRARNSLFCHESEFTVAAPVVDGEAIPASPKRRPPAGFPLFRSLTPIPETLPSAQMAPPRIWEARW
jgi:hypothetical protein